MGNYENIDVDFDGSTYPFNYNPVHAIWQCLLMVGMPESWLDSTSFLEAATTVYNEGIGVGVLMREHQDCLTYCRSLLSHINGVMFYGVNGKFHVKLIRNDYTASTLPVVDITTLLDQPQVTRGSFMETFGEVRIQYNQICKPEIVEEV